MDSMSAAAQPSDRDSDSDSDLEIIDSKSMDNHSVASILAPRRMYTQVPSALATPPQSPSDDGWPPNQAAEMPLVTDLLTRNGQLNVPPGFVLCIPCYLCKQPFNDIETFKEHLTQHAAEIHAWHTAQEQASQNPPMPPMQPPTQPMYQPFLPWPMEFPQQQPPPMVSIPGPGPIQPPMSIPNQMIMDQPPIQFPMQLHQEMPVQSPLEFPGHCPVHQPQPMEYPIHQRLLRSVPLTPQSPIEMMEQQFSYQKMIPPQYQPPMELRHEPHFMMQQPAPPPVELQRIVLQKPTEAMDRHRPTEQPPQPMELRHEPHFMMQQPAPPPVELQRIVLQKPTEAMDRHRPTEQPPQPMELRHEPHFMMQQPAPPPVELKRIVLQKPTEALDRHRPKEQPPQPSEKHLEDQFSIEKHLHIPPSMELQRIVLQKPIEALDRHMPKEQPPQLPDEHLKNKFSIEKRLHISPSMELQCTVLPIEAQDRHMPKEQQPQLSEEHPKDQPQQPVPSPIEVNESHFPEAQSRAQSPEEHQLANQQLKSTSPEMELLQKSSKTPYERHSGRFQCEWCGKRLSSRQSVRYHQSRFHFMEDPPIYEVSENVQKHFKCTTCKKRYKRRTFLLMHMKIKHGICGSEATETTIPAATVESPVEESPVEESLPSPERPSSPSSSEGTRREVWSTKVFNAVAAANYNPATEPAAKYVNPPRQQSELLESTFAAKPKRVYPMRSPFFNPDLWLDCDAYF